MEESAYIGGLGRGRGGDLSAQQPVVVVGVGGGRFSLRLDGDLDIVLGGNDSPPVFLLNG